MVGDALISFFDIHNIFLLLFSIMHDISDRNCFFSVERMSQNIEFGALVPSTKLQNIEELCNVDQRLMIRLAMKCLHYLTCF